MSIPELDKMTTAELHDRFMRLAADRRIAWSRNKHFWLTEIDEEIEDILDAYNSRTGDQ